MTTRDELITALADIGDRNPRATAATWMQMSARAMSNWATDERGNLTSPDVLDRALAALYRKETTLAMAHAREVAEFRSRCPRGGRPPIRRGWFLNLELVAQLARERALEAA